MNRIAPAGDVYQAGTLSGNPLAVAAGRAALERLDEEAYLALSSTTTALAEGLREAAGDRPVSVVHTTGLLTVFFAAEYLNIVVMSLREPAVELAVPLHVAAETDGQAGDDDLERSAERVAGGLGLVDSRDHALLDVAVGAAERRVVGNRADALDWNGQRLVHADSADHRDVAHHLDAEVREQLTHDGAEAHP